MVGPSFTLKDTLQSLINKYSLSVFDSEEGKEALEGTYYLSYGIKDGVEYLSYADKIAQFSFFDNGDKSLAYTLKSRYSKPHIDFLKCNKPLGAQLAGKLELIASAALVSCSISLDDFSQAKNFLEYHILL